MPRQIDNPYWNAGYEAYHAGVQRNDVPYLEDSAEYDIWQDGWDTADSDADDEVFEDESESE